MQHIVTDVTVQYCTVLHILHRNLHHFNTSVRYFTLHYCCLQASHWEQHLWVESTWGYFAMRDDTQQAQDRCALFLDGHNLEAIVVLKVTFTAVGMVTLLESNPVLFRVRGRWRFYGRLISELRASDNSTVLYSVSSPWHDHWKPV